MGLNNEKKGRIHQDLHHLMDIYEKMAIKIYASSSIDSLLNRIDLSYNAKIITVSMLTKFKTHMNLNMFLEEIT